MEALTVGIVLIAFFIGMFMLFQRLDKHVTKLLDKPPAQPNEDDPEFMAYLERQKRRHQD